MKNFPNNNLFYAVWSGTLLFLAFPGAVGLWPLAWLALTPFFLAIKDLPPGSAFRLGLLTGFIHHVTLLYWIIIVLGRYGHLAWWISVPALFLLALYMSLYFGAFAAGLAWMMQRNIPPLWTAPALWVSLDFLRGRLLTGFPWQDLAYTQYRAPVVIQAADLFGHHGITFLIVMVNSLVFIILSHRPLFSKSSTDTGSSAGTPQRVLLPILPAILVVLAILTYNLFRYQQMARLVEESDTLRVAVIQGNISQDLKWTPSMQLETLKIYSRMSTQALTTEAENPGTNLLIWPETALPFYLQGGKEVPSPVSNLVRKNGAWLLTGAPYYDGNSLADPETTVRYYNSGILLNPEGLLNGRYDKQHLVPFGEYIPFRKFFPYLGPVVESIGDFTAGSGSRPLLCETARIGVLICFESIFPDLARKWADNNANLLVNITNDAWFGNSSAPWQHLSMAVFRAVETRRSLARSANTGISGYIDPLGRMSGISPLFQSYARTADVALLEEETIFCRFGHNFAGFCIAFLVFSVGVAKVKDLRLKV